MSPTIVRSWPSGAGRPAARAIRLEGLARLDLGQPPGLGLAGSRARVCAARAWEARSVVDSRAFLEFHHVKMYVNGGHATGDNISLRCWNHNQYEADVFFEGIVREPRAPYALSREHATRSGTGCVRMSPEAPAYEAGGG